MIDERESLERELERFAPDPGILERVALRRERKQRRQRLTAGALGLAIAVVMIAAAVSTLRSPGPVLGDTPLPTASALPKPLVELDPGYHVVDVRTGKASPLPTSITAVEGISNLEVSPDGSMVLFDNSGFEPASERPGLHQVFVANIDGSGVRQVTRDPLGASSGSWSPDGSSIVYLGGWTKFTRGDLPTNLSMLDLESGATTVVATHRVGEPPRFWPLEEPRFSLDGRSILFTLWGPDINSRSWLIDQPQPDLWTVPVEGGEPSVALEDRGYAQVSPDGTSIVYPRTVWFSDGNVSGSFSEVWVGDADGGHPRALVSSTVDPHDSSAGGGWSLDGTQIAYDQALVRIFSGPRGVYVLGIRTGDRTLIAFGRSIDWLDDRTLIINVP
jgi:Tol biopolymer transport system component